ncbi:PAS domain S-box protein [Leptolyngbya sp. AN02str]|uniref:PAS domain S-box protein n=1 Tax=Leptolyngbya sp. AN02str TaxID=3423363 RepID=UPI003D31A7B8
MEFERHSRWAYWLNKISRYRWLPLVLGLVATIAVLGLWQQLLVYEGLHLQMLVRQEAQAVKSELSQELSSRILALEQMASRWQTSGGTPKVLWEADAANYVQDFYGYQAIEWADPAFRVQWLVPLKSNEEALGLDLAQEPRRQITLVLARDLRQTILTRTVSLAQGGQGFLAVVPLFINDGASPDPSDGTKANLGDRFDGAIIGVFRFQALFDSILKISPRYQVQVSDQHGVIYSQFSSQFNDGSHARFAETVVIQTYGIDWTVRVFPTAALMSEGRSLLPTVVLWGGTAGAWILALIVYLAQRSQQYLRAATKNNQRLQQELGERQRIERELRDSEASIRHLSARLELAVQAAGIGIWDLDTVSDRLIWDDQMYRLYGLKPAEFAGAYDAWANAIHPDDADTINAASQHALHSKPDFEAEFRILHPNGAIRYIQTYAIIQRDAQGRAQRMIGVNFDITQRKQSELALHISQARFAGIVEIASDAIITVDADQRITLFNNGAERIFGYEAEEVLGQPLALLLPQQFIQAHHQHVQRYAASDSRARPMAHRGAIYGRRKDGTEFPAEASISKLELNGEVTFTTFLRDITARQQAEAAIARLAAIVESSEDAIVSQSLDGLIESWNNGAEKVFGYTAKEMIGQPITRLIPESKLNDEVQILKQILEGKYIQHYETQHQRKDHSLVDLSISISPIKDVNGTVIGVSKIARDISERVKIEAKRHQIEEALRRSEATKQAIIQAIPDLLIRMQPNGDCVEFYANGSFNLINPAQICGPANIYEVMPYALAQLRAHHIQQALATRQVQVYEQVIDAEGKTRYEEVRIAPLSQTDVLVMVRDITEHTRSEMALKLSEERLHLALEASRDGLWDWDLATGIVYLSAYYQEMLGYAPNEQIMDVDVWESMIHPEDKPWVLEGLQNHLQDHSVQYAFDYRVRCKSGEWKWIADYGKVVARDGQGNPLRMIGTRKDISDRKQKELDLQQATTAAEAANLAKSMFLANMSHELRTPLNVILGFTQLMSHDLSLSASHKADLQTIQRSGDHLLSLINDVLDLSKIEAGHGILEEATFDLISLLHTLRIMMAERAKARSIQLQFHIAPEVPQFIIADEQKLRQILLNLLSNAIKFTHQGRVTLRIGVRSDGLNRSDSLSHSSSSLILCFELCDTGIGIATEELNTIFDAFVQAEAGKKTVSGTGLGLTISRNLLELMHGEISVESVPQVGSTFRFSIPVGSASGIEADLAQLERPVVSLVPGQPHRRILVVDDQRENRLMLVRLLTQLGLDVQEAATGYEAISIWQDWHPDLTWMDIRMPGLDGYETTRQIRALEQGHASIIIALTAQASQSDRTLALAAGCNDYMSKPFREETLFLKLKEYLGLEFRYAEPDDAVAWGDVDVTRSTPFDANLLAQLPAEWLATVEHAAICGNDRAIMEQVLQLPPELTPFGTLLAELAQQFQFEQIINMLHATPPASSFTDFC